jgi:hypothetical protein
MAQYIVEERTANHEIISAMLFGAGMVVLIINHKAGMIIMLASMVLLFAIYSYRLFSTPSGSRVNGKFWLVRRINYSILITVIVLLSLLILDLPGRNIYGPVAGVLLIIPCLVNIATHKKQYFRMNYAFCQIRLVIYISLTVFFYLLPF